MPSSIMFFTTILTDCNNTFLCLSLSPSQLMLLAGTIWYAEHGGEYREIGILKDVIRFTSCLELQQWAAAPHVEDEIHRNADT